MAKSRRKRERSFKKLFWWIVVVAVVVFSAKTYQDYREKTALNNCERLRQEISKYDWDQKIAFAIAKAESKCDPNALGDENLKFESCIEEQNVGLEQKEPFKDYKEVPCGLGVPKRTYGYSVGAFQVRILPGRTECDNFDLATNVKCAYKIYQEKENSFTPWSVFLNGKYLQFME